MLCGRVDQHAFELLLDFKGAEAGNDDGVLFRELADDGGDGGTDQRRGFFVSQLDAACQVGNKFFVVHLIIYNFTI